MRREQPKDISWAELGSVGLVTLALGAVLLTPLVPALDSSGPAQAKEAAEDAARSTESQLRREISSAAGIIEPNGRALNLRVPDADGTQVVVRAEDAVLDIVPPRPRSHPKRDESEGRKTEGEPQDPPRLRGPEQPLAPQMIVVRFFVGLRYPIDPQAAPGRPEENEPQPYVNRYAGMPAAQGGGSATLADSYVARHGVNNPYILYRVNFTPYRLIKKGEPGYRGPEHPAYVVNEQIFAADRHGLPVFDDPDFFRVVTTGDRNPATGRSYTASEATAHNERVGHWVSLSKPVMSDLDLDVLEPKSDPTNRAALSIKFVPSVPKTDAGTLAVPGRTLFYTKGTVHVDLGLRVYDDRSGVGETARRAARVVIGSDRTRDE